MDGKMARYRIQGRIGPEAGEDLDQFIRADDDQEAIAIAKSYPVVLGPGHWVKLTDERGRLVWEMGAA